MHMHADQQLARIQMQWRVNVPSQVNLPLQKFYYTYSYNTNKE
jgi:hypothetical protein